MLQNRIAGDYGDPDSEQLVLLLAGVHGNELGGVRALDLFFRYLNEHKVPLKARVVGLIGHLSGIYRGVRFFEEDLNRLWADQVMHLALNHPSASPELAELAGIAQALKAIDYEKYPKRFFLDLHETSAENGIFLIVADYLQIREILDQLHAPVVLGLDRALENTSIGYMSRQGFIAMGFEGGRIGSTESVMNHQKMIWQLLERTGAAHIADLPDEISTYHDLEHFAACHPSVLTLDYVHKTREDDHFQMVPGFKNFDRVTLGQLLAHDVHGPIMAKSSGYILMPRYQPKGTDGFFIMKPV